METPEKNKQELVKKDSQELLLSTSTLTLDATIVLIAKIKIVYPSLIEGFYDILLERLKFYKFSDMEFEKTVNHIFDTSKYPPQISDFISYMRPDGIADIPDRTPENEKKVSCYNDIDWSKVPENKDNDLGFLDKYGPEDEKEKKKPKGFEDFEPSTGQD